MRKFVACSDLGGTKVRSAIFDSQMGLLPESIITLDTEVSRGREAVLANIERSIREAATAAGMKVPDLAGLGMGSPGPLYLDKGMIGEARNMGPLMNFPIRDEMRRRLGIAVYLDNDANVFVLGEAVHGAGRGYPIVFGVTLGTGLGAGLVIDGILFGGATGTAAEIWNFRYGESIIEEYVSGRAIGRFFRTRTGEERLPKDVADLARAGHEKAREAWNEFGFHLGVALSYCVNVIDPHVVVVGGSISSQFDLFSEAMEEAFRPHVNVMPREKCRILPACLAEDAPLLGAAALVRGK